MQVNAQQPEALFGLSDKVKEQFSERIARLSDDEIHSHQKVAAFKDSIGNASKQSKAVDFFLYLYKIISLISEALFESASYFFIYFFIF